MEKELNIAAILRDKPKYTRLWSPLYGEVFFNRLVDEGGVRVLCKRLDGSLGTDEKSFWKNGKFTLGGEVCLFPSKAMLYWSKFAWKKGDVLATDINTLCIFEGWANDEYTQFKAKYNTRRSDWHFYSDEVKPTCNWAKLTDDDVINQYISKIEEHYGGKFNLSTLGIEKPQFEDGDVGVYTPTQCDILAEDWEVVE